MYVQICKSKLHKAVVTQAELDYEGSITLDENLMEAAGIVPFERVLIANFSTGARFETYAIAGPRNSGVVCLNGAAAKLAKPGDAVTVLSFALCTPQEAKTLSPKMVLLNSKNEILRTCPV